MNPSPSLNKEREAFEAWRRRTAKTANPDKAVALNGFGDDAQYDVPATRAMWAAWQARAALASTPSALPVEGAGQVEAAQLLFDFGGFLTSSKRQWVFSSHDDAAPMVDAIRAFAAQRGIDLDAPHAPAPAPTEPAVLKQIASLLSTMFAGARAHVRGPDEEVAGYTVNTGALHKIVGILVGQGHRVIIPSNLPTAHEHISGILLGTKEAATPVVTSGFTDDMMPLADRLGAEYEAAAPHVPAPVQAAPTEHEIIAGFLERTGQYVTNDASREAAVKHAVTDTDLQYREAMHCLSDVMRAANHALVGMPPSETEAKLRAELFRAHVWFMAEVNSDTYMGEPANQPKENDSADDFVNGCPHCGGTGGHWEGCRAPVQAAPTEPIKMWHARIKEAHPISEPEYWPNALKVEYMEAEILELRAALATPAPVAADTLTDGQCDDIIGAVRSVFGGQSGSSDPAKWASMNLSARNLIRAAATLDGTAQSGDKP